MMERSGTSTSSKVTVEYSDPSGVFSLVSNDLYKSLPLRNLHWNSSSRPLRFIDSLHVELIKDDQRIPQNASSTDDASQTRASGAKERRHQFPGLRQTPYLKIYFLQCDDTETYKNTSRRLLREWVKDHTPPSQSSSAMNKAENHDAFEWLIIHVVVPANDMTKGSRLSGSSKGEGHNDKSSATSRRPNRNSSSIIEKVRSDFNGTSKTAIDRVAQIQIDDSTDEIVSSEQQQQQEDLRGFKDLVSKLKFLILASFDQRVSQYEEDIREKDSQRNIPGWNFNTFFILKEGLARGFESVGLIEDALASYHELSTNLNDVVGEARTKAVGDRTNPFREFTEDLLDVFSCAIKASSGATENLNIFGQLQDLGSSMLNTDRKPYREMILENNVSAFDFLCYVFARKVSLQLRLANVGLRDQTYSDDNALEGESYNGYVYSAASKSVLNSEEVNVENLLILADICHQASEFFITVTPTIRKDLSVSTKKYTRNYKTHALSDSVRFDVIENIIASWTFSASKAILEMTSVRSLHTQIQPLIRKFKSYKSVNEASKDKMVNSPEPVNRKDFSIRTGSLVPQAPTFAASSKHENFPSAVSSDTVRPLPPASSQTGLQYLATQQADLYSLARHSLGGLGLRHANWKASWSGLNNVGSVDNIMDEVSLEDDADDAAKASEIISNKIHSTTFLGLQNRILRLALASKSSFYSIYEDLTASTLALLILGDRPKSAEVMTADIAAIRLYVILFRIIKGSAIDSRSHLEDFAAAASYFHQLAPFYAKEGWGHLEISMLDMYAQCLKRLSKKDDYVRIGLKIVAKLANLKSTATEGQQSQNNVSFSLTKLIDVSRVLTHPATVSMDSYFGSIILDQFSCPYEDRDGFQIHLQIRSYMQETMEAHHVQVNLISTEDDRQSGLCLVTNTTYFIEPGITKISVGTNAMIPGWYTLDKVLIKAGNIIFTREYHTLRSHALPVTPASKTSSKSIDNSGEFRLLVWPQIRSMNVRLSLCNTIHLEHPRSLDVEVSTGWNDILQGQILLRAGSAGLRLHTADAVIVGGNSTLLDQSQPGDIAFGNVSADSRLVLRIPYGVESDLKEITVKIEVLFTTAKGNFTYCCSPTIPILLPLGVNVQDTFQQSWLFSKFTISTSNATPLRISSCHLQSSVNFDVTSSPLEDEKFDVFARQPLSFISRICRKSQKDINSRLDRTDQKRLLLQIRYRCLDQEISETIERSLLESLSTSNLQEISRLLIPNVLVIYRSQLSSQELERIGILREMDISDILDAAWVAVASGVRPGCRGRTTKWLKGLHKEYSRLQLLKDSDMESKPQFLTVPVDIPQVGAVHTASIQFRGQKNSQAKIQVAKIGQPINAELVIKHTRQWLDQAKQQTYDKPPEFFYEIQANPDTWLIGGQKRAHFFSRENQVLRFPLLLLPLKAGHLLFPSVDVSKRHEVSHLDGEQQVSGKELDASETDYRNQGDTILVVSDLSSTTVSLDPGSAADGAWLMESQPGPNI